MHWKTRTWLINGGVLAIVVVFSVVLILSGTFAAKPQPFSPHYLSTWHEQSRIYDLSETTSFSTTESELTAPNGTVVAAGSELFTINLSLRNDYSNQNPPPPNGSPISPADGTAYLYLKATLYKNDVAVDAVNVTPSSYACPDDQTVQVLASGQTGDFKLQYATNETAITGYTVWLMSVYDSIR